MVKPAVLGLEFLILHVLILQASFRGWMKSWLSNCTPKVPKAWEMAQQVFWGWEGGCQVRR